MIPTLIDKQDTFEIIRDKIASILVAEIASQQALAVAAGEDPDLWKVRIYKERSNAWEQWLADSPADTSPICNVWFDNSNYDQSAGNVAKRQKSTSVYNLDCLGYGVSEETETGHTPGDQVAAEESQRAFRLIRNIIMASEYTYLGLRKTVWKRWPLTVRAEQPEYQAQANKHITAVRFALQVEFNELSPQGTESVLEQINATVRQDADGEQVMIEAEFDTTV